MDSSQGSSPNDQRQEDDVVPLVSKDSPTAEKAQSDEPVHAPNAKHDSSDQSIGTCREGSNLIRLPAVEPFLVVPKELPTAEEVRSGKPARDPNAKHNSSNQSIGIGSEKSDPSPGIRAMDPSIHMSSFASDLADQSASDRPPIGRRTYRSVSRFFITAMIGAFIGVAASSAWQSTSDKAMEMVRILAPSLGLLSSEWQSGGAEAKRIVATWASSLDWSLPISTKSLREVGIPAKQTGSTATGQVSVQDVALRQSAPLTQQSTSAAASISPELVQQIKAVEGSLTRMRHKVEQLAAMQEQMAHNIASLQAAERDIRQKMSSPSLSQAVPLPPRRNAARPLRPPARASILTEWWIRNSHDGYVYVQDHSGVYQVALGAPLPGLGPVEQVKRQDGRWVVVTPKGIIVSKRDRRYFERH
jgi:hypothetical protein